MASDESSASDRACRARLLMDAAVAAAASADPVARVDTPSVPGQGWTSADLTLTVEIRVSCLPGGLVTAFPTYHMSGGEGMASVGPPFILDPADPGASLTLAAEVERLVARIGGNLDAWQIRVSEPGPPAGLPADEPWLERPSHDAILERLRAARTGRGGEVAFAIVEAPRWVMRLAVGGRPGDLRIRGRLVDRLVRIDRSGRDGPPRWRGEWRLRGQSPDPSRMLEEITQAILAQAPEASEGGPPTIAVRLEQNASASSAEAYWPLTGCLAWVGAMALGFVLLGVFAPTTGFFGPFAEARGSAVGIVVVTLVGLIPALAAGMVAGRTAERLRVRWSRMAWIRWAAIAGTYLAWFAAVSLLPNWGAVLALTMCGGIGWAVVAGLRWRRAAGGQDPG